MWAKDRHHLIISKLGACDRVSIDELMEDLRVSRETVRRDIVTLEAEGRLRRVHGGAERLSPAAELPFEDRKVLYASAKRRIGLSAARLVEPGMLIAIDAGTTTAAFASTVASIPDVSVVSNSAEVLRAILAKRPNADVVQIGGRISLDLPGTHGAFAISQVRRFAADMAFFSPVGLSAKRGATYFHLVEAEFSRAMVETSKRAIALVDSSKLGLVSRVESCECSAIDVLVTDRTAGAKELDTLRGAGLAEIIVDA